MRLITLAFIFAATAFNVKAQSIDEGKKHLYYERYESATNTLQQLVKQQPDNAQAWHLLTHTYLQKNQAAKAADSLKLAPASVLANPYGKIAQASVMLHEGNVPQATQLLNAALNETRHKDVAVLTAAATALIEAKQGDANAAIGLLEKAIKRDKKNPELYVLLGDAYRKLSNGTEAYRSYQRAIQADGSYAKAHHRMAGIFMSQQNPDMYVPLYEKAVAVDANYAPALYNLYVYEFYRDPAKAMNYYNKYVTVTDKTDAVDYDLTDLYFVGKQYDKAIEKGNELIERYADSVKPRIFKLVSFSYAEKKDTAKALNYLEQYFANEVDTNITSKDYATMGTFYGSMPEKDSMAAIYISKAADLEKDSTVRFGYYKQLADMAKERKDYKDQAIWLEKYFVGNNNATNLDLFNWGLAHYMDTNYVAADTVFAQYVAKYPEQSFGYYWQAKSQALIDRDMEQGLAIPTYTKLVEVLQNDTTENGKKWMVEAYGYLAAYEANTQKDYVEAVDYFEKLLEVDPENEDAKKYIEVLEKSINQAEAGNR